MEKKWKRLTIRLSEQDYDDLKIVASIRKESAGAFVRYLVDFNLKSNQELIPVIKAMREAQATKSF